MSYIPIVNSETVAIAWNEQLTVELRQSCLPDFGA